RKWDLFAAAIMGNHVHIVVGVPGDPNPEDILRDFKSYGSRALNRTFGHRPGGTWWTTSGSKRKLRDEASIHNAIEYVRNQEYRLVVWVADEETIWRAVMNMKKNELARE